MSFPTKFKGFFAFSLLEMILSVSLVSLLVGLSAPVVVSFQERNGMVLAREILANNLRRAALLSLSREADTSWGVRINTSSMIFFRGASFLTRDLSYDEVFDFYGGVIASGTQEFVFAKLTGLPQSSGTVLFSLYSGESQSVLINEKGVILY